jgi:hypothetical protein
MKEIAPRALGKGEIGIDMKEKIQLYQIQTSTVY